jgi:hypothetical protein
LAVYRSIPFRRAAGPHSGQKADRPSDASTDQVRVGRHLKTAEALGLTIPETLLATADEVIE